MSEGRDGEDQTEEATEKKLRDAAERGDLPVSREAPLFAGLLATLLVCSLVLRDGVARVTDTLGRLLDDPGRWALHNGADAVLLFNVVLEAAAGFVLPILLIFVVSGLAISFAQNAPSLVLARIQPKLAKISPSAGLGRLFGRAGLFEFLKGALKLVAIGLIATLLLHAEQRTVVDTMFVAPAAIPDRLLGIVLRLLAGVATAFVLLAAGDMVWTRISWAKRMRMSRREVKEEHKQAEGDPILKAKRRSLALDRSRRRMIAEVPRATLVIANPTHFAIALRYVRSEGSAPTVVAKGQDLIALKIREIAEQNGIAVVENKALARSMYDQVEVAQVIPPQFYKAVAETIHYVQSRDAPTGKPRTPMVLR